MAPNGPPLLVFTPTCNPLLLRVGQPGKADGLPLPPHSVTGRDFTLTDTVPFAGFDEASCPVAGAPVLRNGAGPPAKESGELQS